jgi:hypothetical protein
VIEVFDVNHNELSGYVSEEWGRIWSLRELGLGGNKFTGDIPEEVSRHAAPPFRYTGHFISAYYSRAPSISLYFSLSLYSF